MPELVADCPRCGAKSYTFILKSIIPTHVEYNWQNNYEAFCLCKNCIKPTTFFLAQKDIKDTDFFREIDNIYQCKVSLNNYLDVEGFLNLRNMLAQSAPEYTPSEIAKIFLEGSQSVSGKCPNAAGAMFRLCIDLASKALLPKENKDDQEKPDSKVIKFLKPRLAWLFEAGLLPSDLEELSDCIREDGNDSAYDGTITIEEAEDLMEFTILLLERLYTEPAKLDIANARRLARREGN